MADGAAGAAFGVTLGNQIGSIVTNAIMTGFQKSMQLIKKPFTFLAHEFSHAMGEEMADITAAGSMFALDKASGTKMFKDFEDARMAQEMLDQRLAKSASSLPGQTLQYVQQARQLQDTIMQALGKDQEGFMKKAEEMGAIAGDMKDSFAVVLSQFTERAVLLGQDQGGSGGLGVPQLLEQMVGMETVKIQSMGMRYGALRTNPLLKGALERNETAINATTVGTIERIQAIQKALDEALPQEVITGMTMTMNGISEGFRSSLLDISAGLFGIRRMVTGVKAQAFKMTGDIKADVAESLSLFDMLRDTIGFFVVPFLQLANILPQIYDPMLGLIDTLIPLRKIGAGFSSVFHQFSADYEAFAKEAFPDLKTQSKFLETRGPRAALMAIGTLLEDFDPSFSANQTAAELRKLDVNFGEVAKDLITRLLNSDVMEMIGETVGNFASELLTVMANLLTGVTEFATTSRFAKGLVKGLEGRIGKDGKEIGMSAWQAIRTIFDKVFEIMGKLLLTIVTQMPMQTALFVGITAILPAALAALGTKIGIGLGAVLSKVGSAIQTSLSGTGGSLTAGRLPGPRMPMTPGPKGGGYLPAADQLGKAAKTAKSAVSAPAGAVTGLAQKGGLLSFFGGAGGKNFVAGLKAVSPKLLIFGGVLSAIIALFEGKGIVGALAAGLGAAGGSAIGAAIGTVIFPGIGTALGAAIGGWIGSLEPVTQFLEGIFVGLGDALGPIGASLADIGHTLWMNLTEMWGVITGIIPGLKGLEGEFSALRAGVTTIKILLFPLTATLDLINVALQGLRIGFLYLQKWIAGIPGIGRLAGDQKEIQQKINDAQTKFGETLRKNNDKYSWNEFTGANIAASRAARDAADALKNTADSAGQAATNLNEYQTKTRELIAQGKASGLTPTASDMEWYRAKMASTGAAIPQTATVPQPSVPAPPSPIPAIEALSTKQTTTNAHLAQIDAKTLPQQQINPVPQLQVANTNLTAVQEYVKGVTASIGAAKNELKQQIAASSNNIQARIQEGTAATRAITNAFLAGINVRVTNSPTVKFDMGGMGPVGGGIGGFPKTSGYGMRWGKMHTGNDYGMPVGTKLGIGGPGKVLGAGYWGGYGNTMDIGGPGGMVYRFAHLSKFNAPVGANLPPGYPFALSGNTGNSTGPHLHFEARPGGLGPVNPDAFAGIIRANFGGTPLGPLMGAMGTEMKNMPYGSQLAVSNSDEIFMKPKQMAHVIESSARAGAEGVGNVSMSGVTININGYDKDPKELTDSIASELLTAIYRKSRSEVLTS
jgi:murein DD-endopeptidase MepM/ murein hydrolase activator NlpD